MYLDEVFWRYVVGGIGTSAITSAAFFQILRWRFERDLESHKASLSANENQAIERIRAEAAIATERFKKNYGLLADRQAEVIEKIYLHLADINIAAQHCLSPMRIGGEPADVELYKTLVDARWNGYAYFLQKRLFLPSGIGSHLQDIFQKLSSIELQYKSNLSGNRRTSDEWKEIGKLYDELNGPIAHTLLEIEDAFRVLLSGEKI